MKFIRRGAQVLLITAMVLFTTLFVYANWKGPRLAYTAPPAQYAAFDLQQDCSPADKTLVENTIGAMQGVSAVTVNPASRMAVVAYNPTLVNDPSTFAGTITSVAHIKAVPKEWKIDPNQPQCPANGFLAWLDRTCAVLCLRTR